MKKEAQRIRVNLRLPPDLVKWAKTYAKKHKLNFTEVVEQALGALKDRCD